MKSTYPEVIALVLNYNGMSILYKGIPILKSCLETLTETDYDNLKIILIDAGSKDGSVEYVKKNFPQVDILKVENRGFAYCNNQGMLYAQKRYPNFDYILLINNDVIFKETSWLTKLEGAFYKSPDIGIVGGRLLKTDGTIQSAGIYIRVWGLPDNHKTDRPSRFVKGVIGALFMVKREALEEIGLFDNIYNPFLEEEIDFCLRAESFGYKTYYVKDINVIHLEGSTIVNPEVESKWGMETREFVFARNNYIFILRWYPYLLPANIAFRLALPIVYPILHNTLKRSNIHYQFHTFYPALKEAIKLYNKRDIPHLKATP